MLRLDTTTSSLQAVLAGAVATTEPQATVCFSDDEALAATYTGGKQVTVLSGASDVTICAAPAASIIRDIDTVTLHNRDTASITVTIKYDISGTDSIIVRTTLLTLETLQFNHGDGWKVIDASGNIKTSASGLPTGAAGGDLTGTYPNPTIANGAIALDELSDVVITAPATGATLIYDGANWIDGALNLADTDAVSGVLPVVNGGSGGLPDTAPGGRLTLTTATPVLTSTVSAATTIFYALYINDQVPLYDGTNWFSTTFTELSQSTTDTTKSPAAVANNSNYDMFVWNNAGTIRCTRGPAWTSDTARGTGAGTTELVRQNGVWMNNVAITNGPGAKRGTYVGTVRSNGTASIDWILGGTAASGVGVFLNVWNTYNRVIVVPWSQDSSGWSYNSTTKRAMDGSNNNRLSFIRGLNEEEIAASLQITFTGGAAGDYIFAISLDSTTTVTQSASYGSFGSFTAPGHAVWSGIPGLGFHFLQAIEYQLTIASAASGVGTISGQTGFEQLRGAFRC